MADDRPTGLRVVIISMELCYDVFSGNGVLGRTLVNSLLSVDPTLELLLVCGRDAAQGGGNNAALFVPEANRERVTVYGVPLPSWGKLDHDGPWREFADALQHRRQRWVDFGASATLSVDWAGWLACQEAGLDALPSVWLCFRVFHANLTAEPAAETARAFYRQWESHAAFNCSVPIILSSSDAGQLTKLLAPAQGGEDSTTEHREGQAKGGAAQSFDKSFDFEIVFPPLRSDLSDLAARTVPAPAPHTGAITPQRRYLTCCCRLSPEKNVEAFVATVEAIGAAKLAEIGLVPRLVGSASDQAYATAVTTRLQAACPAAVVEGFSKDPEYLAQLFSETWINVHPALYEAFGMTIIEAAAFGAPSLVDGAGGIGAAELVRPGHDEAVAADLRDPAAVAGLLVGILAGDHAKVAAISANARARAVAHDQLAYGRAIHRSLTECSR